MSPDDIHNMTLGRLEILGGVGDYERMWSKYTICKSIYNLNFQLKTFKGIKLSIFDVTFLLI